MSNTDGNIERSARRHRPAIWGITIAVLAAVIALLVFAPWQNPPPASTGEVTPPATVAPGNTAPAAPAANP